jgi:hypothetical protein
LSSLSKMSCEIEDAGQEGEGAYINPSLLPDTNTTAVTLDHLN